MTILQLPPLRLLDAQATNATGAATLLPSRFSKGKISFVLAGTLNGGSVTIEWQEQVTSAWFPVKTSSGAVLTLNAANPVSEELLVSENVTLRATLASSTAGASVFCLVYPLSD
jgi:hypothetical protein